MKKNVAIIVGCGAYNDLGMIRSCGEAKMEVFLIAPSTMVVPIYKSKYVERWIPTDVRSEDAVRRSIEDIVNGLSKNRKFFLIPTGDLQAIVVDEIKDSLPSFVYSPSASQPIAVLMDKDVMVKIAKESGFNVPNTLKVDIDEVDKLVAKLPCIIKPLTSAYGEKADISVCHDMGELKLSCQRFREHGTTQVLIQDFVNGPNQKEIAVTGVSHGNGQITIGGTIVKERTTGNGSTIFAKFIPGVDAYIEKAISDFMQVTGYKGIFDIEFLKNDNGCYFIECNFRNGAYGYALTSAGLNLPQCLVEGPNFKMRHIREIVFMEERSDILNPIRKNMSWLRWFKDVCRTNTFLWWNIKDPMPTIAYYRSKVISRISKTQKIKCIGLNVF